MKGDVLRATCVLVLGATLCLAQPMAGVYPVGLRGPGVDSFASIQAAAAALSVRGMAGDVDFPIQQAVYAGPVLVRSVAGSDSFRTRFYPSGAGATIDAAGGRYGLAVESTENVTLQGLRFRGCRDSGSAFVQFTAARRGTVRSLRLEDSAQVGVQVIASDSFLAESLKLEGDLRAGDSRGMVFLDCRYAFATRCTMLGRVGNGLWIEGGEQNGNYRVTVSDPAGHGLHIENSPMARIHNFVSRGSPQYGGYVVNSPFSMFDSCVFAGAARTGTHFENCESLVFDMGMGIGEAERAVAVVNSPYSQVMKLSVMGSPAVGLYIKGSPETHAESTQYAGFSSDTATGVLVDSSDCTMLTYLQMYGRLGRGISVRKSTDVKVKHARMDISVAEAGLYLTQADRFAVRPCSLMMAGAGAAVVVADTSVDDSFQRLTITGTLRDGLRAQGARRLVVANSFISGWSGSGVVLEQTSAARLFYTTIVGPLSGPGDGVRLRDATGTTALNNVNWTRGGDSAACFRVDGVWPFTPGGVDHNDLFAPNGSIARVNDTLVRTLTEWRALGASPDPASISRDPQLVSDTSHRILETSPCRDSGVPVPGFETDLDGDERDPATPDIGADEYTAPGVAEWPAARPGPVLSADNPVGRTARLRYVLAEAAEVRVRLVDVAGRAVCAVEAGVQRPGLREFRLDVGRLTTGVYLCRLDAGALKGAVKLVKR